MPDSYQGRPLTEAERAMFSTAGNVEAWREALAIMLTEMNGRIKDASSSTIDMINKLVTRVDARFDALHCGEHTAMLAEINRRGSEANAPKLAELGKQIEELERQMTAVSAGSKHRYGSSEELPAPRPKTDPNNPSVRQSDLASFVRPLAERVAEDTAEIRVAELEGQRDKMARALESVREKAKQEAAAAAAEIELARITAEDRKRQFMLKAAIGLISALVSGGVVSQLKCELPAARSQQVAKSAAAPAAAASRPARDASVFHNRR